MRAPAQFARQVEANPELPPEAVERSAWYGVIGVTLRGHAARDAAHRPVVQTAGYVIA